MPKHCISGVISFGADNTSLSSKRHGKRFLIYITDHEIPMICDAFSFENKLWSIKLIEMFGIIGVRDSRSISAFVLVLTYSC